MTEDIRDVRLGSILEETIHDLRPSPGERLPGIVRRGSRRRTIRWVATIAALVVFVGSVGSAGLLIRSNRTVTPTAPPDWETTGSLDTTGWTFNYPSGWRLVPLPACSNRPERTGAIVTNVDFDFLNPEGQPPQCADRLVLDGFPSDGVAVAMEPVGILPVLSVGAPNTPFPISPDQLEPTGGIIGGPSSSYLAVLVHGDAFGSLRTWIGSAASQTSIDDVNAVVGSLDVAGAPRWSTYRGQGFEITYPDDWVRAGSTLTPQLSDPREILSIGTYPLRPGGETCNDVYLPGNALGDLGIGDVFITIQESSGGSGFPPRPSSFGPDAAQFAVDGPACDSYGPIELRGWWFGFSDQGRYFYAFVTLGPGVSHDGQVLRIAWHIMNSFHPDPATT